MSKIVLDEVTNSNNISKINENFAKLENALNNQVLYRDSPVGNPNALVSDIDVNGVRLYNLPEPVLMSQAARLQDVKNAIAGASSANLISFTPSGSIDSTTVQSAIQELDTEKTTLAIVLSQLGTSTGSSQVGFLQGGIGAITRTSQDKMRERVSVKDFGAIGDGVVDDTLAVFKARTFLQTNNNSRGGTLYFPKGEYKMSQELAFTQYVAGSLHSIYIEGDGAINTILNFSTASAGTNGISFGAGAHFGIRDLEVFGAKQDGIFVGATGADYAEFFTISNVRVQGNGRDGIRFTNTYMGTLNNVWSRDNAGYGIAMLGFHTSMSLNTCYASGNTLSGYILNGMVYSKLDCCGSDENQQQGYAISNCHGVTLLSCGAESNKKEGFYVYTSTVSTTGLPVACQDINGVVLQSCYGFSNSVLSAGSYATFVGCSTQNSRPINLSILGGSSVGAAAGDFAIALAGSSGKITCTKDNFVDTLSVAVDQLSGSYEVKNKTMSGRSCVVGMLSGTQTLTTGVAALMSLSATPAVNDLGATVVANGVVIPRGVNKVKVSFSVWFDANATSVRQAFLYKNGAGVAGLPAITTNGTSAGSTLISGASAVIPVVAGDSFTLSLIQYSGGNLNISSGTASYLTVEAVQ